MTLLVGASPAEARAQTLASPARILNKPVAVYPYGATGTMTSAPDGSICYAAEGGAIAILNARTTSLQDGDKLPAPFFRGPVGFRGVVPIDMVLDPDANPGDPTAPNNYIYRRYLYLWEYREWGSKSSTSGWMRAVQASPRRSSCRHRASGINRDCAASHVTGRQAAFRRGLSVRSSCLRVFLLRRVMPCRIS